jgi:hypothetical protein
MCPVYLIKEKMKHVSSVFNKGENEICLQRGLFMEIVTC